MLPYIIDGLDQNKYYACIDECGRGSFAGPVCAGVVIWDHMYEPKNDYDKEMLELVNDSKKLTPKKREKVATFIKENAVDYYVSAINSDIIDEINILEATYKAMHYALDNINKDFEYIMVDGDKFKNYYKNNNKIDHKCIVKGDSLVFGIAAASIISKVYHDELMIELHNKYPMYGFNKNMGYGTKVHRDAIKEHGIINGVHRKTFVKNWI